MKIRAAILCLFVSTFVLSPCRADTQSFKFKPPSLASDAATAAVMHDLAIRILPVYETPDRLHYLANLSALQMVAGDYKAAYASRQSLQDLRHSKKIETTDSRSLLLDLYAHAKAMQASDKTPFTQAFATLFHSAIPKLSDLDAYAFTRWQGAPPASFLEALQRAFDQARPTAMLSAPQALTLIRTYLAYDIHRQTASLIDTLAHEDDQQRYVIEDDVPIKTPGGAILHAQIVRPKEVTGTLPTLLEFGIAPSRNDAIACAAHGYAGVTAYTRDVGDTEGSTPPFRHAGEEADAVVKWIAGQSWSDGRVGMYGNGYSGFAAWAATRHPPSALKAIATSDAMAPGIDFPVQGRIYQNSALRWIDDHTPSADQASKDYDAYWRALNQQWYRSGKPYRDLDQMTGSSNPTFQHWLDHPGYDPYWQEMIPFAQQFAKIDIPTLSVTGYYAGGEAGSLYYFSQLQQYKAKGDHTLLIGPYDDHELRTRPSPVLRHYWPDPVANIDLRKLRFQWFNHVFEGDPTPPLLAGNVNYEVMGANQWRHATSLKTMATGVLKFYLTSTDNRDHQRLSQTPAVEPTQLTQTVDFADRGDAGRLPHMDIVHQHLVVYNGIVFVSDPLKQAVEINGQLSGQLDFTVNKMDMDLYVSLYEQQPDGSYFELSDPYEFRTSYAGDRTHRHLLKVGVRQQLAFTSTRLTSRKLQVGSRIVLVLGVNKRPDQEINYGAGMDVSKESIANAKTPLKVSWYSDSHIDVPIQGTATPQPATASKPRQPSPPPAAPGSK